MTGEYLRGMTHALDIQPQTLAAEVDIDPTYLSRLLNNRKDLPEKQSAKLLLGIGAIRARHTKKLEPTAGPGRAGS